ncbi:MAG: hypothetical protein R6V83_00810 [Candidatus Thorarchaeota archaeon]
MIVTVTGVVILALGILSLALAFYGGWIAASITEGSEIENEHRSEYLYYLLSMIGLIVLVTRLFNVPLFFWLLQSLVPFLPGAMCAYGVVNAGYPFSTMALLSKLILPLFYGVWLTIDLANRRQPRIPLMKTLARTFLVVLLPLVLFDSTVDLVFVITLQPIDVPCCSSVYDVNPPFSPSSLFGPVVSFVIMALTVILALALSALQWLRKDSNLVRFGTVALSGIVAILYVLAIHDVLAPLSLGLATHHCPYCLFQEFPDTALFAGVFWLGIAASVWRVILEITWKRNGLDGKHIEIIALALRKISSVALLFSMVSAVSHIMLAL